MCEYNKLYLIDKGIRNFIYSLTKKIYILIIRRLDAETLC